MITKTKLLLSFVLLTLTGFLVALLFLRWSHSPRSASNPLITQAHESLKSTHGHTNILLMGIGGQGHQAPDLTDSMIFLSINPAQNRLLTIPLPRDIWLDSLQAKLNTAYHYGNQKHPGGGLDLAKAAVTEITGQPVHYAVVIDFQGFVRLIDLVGGIDVQVERAFDDYKYPIPGKENAEPESERYQHLHFDAGLQHMDGQTALKFARSRHAQGYEGTDFARSARQQKVILALKDKIFSTQILLHPQTFFHLIQALKSSVDTDITSKEYADFLKLALSLKNQANFQTASLNDFLIHPLNQSQYANQWVLIPKNNWQEVHAYIEKLVQN